METAPTTRFFKSDDVQKKWYLVDASGKTLGRLASRIAHILRGKHKPTFTPNFDVGDFVVVVNAEQVELKGKRGELKELFRTSGYPGGARFDRVKDMLQTRPEYVIEHAVRGMLPHNKLGRRIAKKLKVYKGGAHPHAAQKPEQLEL